MSSSRTVRLRIAGRSRPRWCCRSSSPRRAAARAGPGTGSSSCDVHLLFVVCADDGADLPGENGVDLGVLRHLVFDVIQGAPCVVAFGTHRGVFPATDTSIAGEEP